MDGATLYNTVAPLRNVAALAQLIDRVKARAHGLPGMGTFYGPSGFGKTTAAIYATNRFQAVNVQVKSAWTRKKLCEAILHEMGVPPRPTVGDMVDQIAQQLALLDVPLIVDEADFLVARKMIEILRDIHEGSGAPVVLIGEELLPQKLQP
jgi:DNA transposition AAA+ family ATPase